MQNLTDSPPRAPPIKYTAPLGTRWAKEKAAAGGAAAFDLPTDPKTIGPWILGECVGKGASGRVKIAKHRRTGELAAVKILPIAPLVNSRASLATQQAKSDKQRLGIDREITMMKLMNHPNIMRIYDVYEGEKELFLVLEYVEGGELFDFLVNRGRLPPNEALIYFRQIVYGLNYAHTFSIIHRDLKPENILIASLSPPVVKIADWGMAAFAPPCLQLETSCGSPHYASPEIVNGDKYEGNATDIWSCGVILYALLTGRLPFDDKNVRNLLSKVKSGRYDIPSWMDPLAKDLLSKMLVVDVNKRITIPEILSHPWLLSKPEIPFAASDGNTFTLLAPPLPPSPSVLARPIATPELIDSELFSSLRIIWGRHTDALGESIRRDLCSPAGQGLHAKAFYFLLGKYREESSKSRLSDAEYDHKRNSACSVIDLETLRLNLTWELETTGSGLRKYEGPKMHPLFSVPQTTLTAQGSSTAAPPAYAPNGPIVQPPAVASRKRTFTDGSLPAKIRADLQAGRGHEVELWKAQMQAASASSSSGRPKSSITVGSRGYPRPPPFRRGHTCSLMPEKRDGGAPGSQAVSSIGFSQQLQQLQARTTSISSSQRPKSSAGPISPFSEAEKKAMFSGLATESSKTQSQRASCSVDVPMSSPMSSASHPDDPIDLPLLTAPKSEDPRLQLTMDDLTQKVNDLVQAASQAQSLEPVVEDQGPTEPLSLRRHRHKHVKVAAEEDKENQSMDEEWSHVCVDGNADRSSGLGLGVGGVAENRGMGRDVGNTGPVSLSPTKSKKDKEKKLRPPPLELPSLHQKRNTFAMLGSPIILSSPIHPPPSSATRLMASPVVGEFKGWFSNLFNWKSSSSSGGVLYSVDEIQRTRATVCRIMEGLGITVAGHHGDYQHIEHGETLFCRVEHPSTDPITGISLKAVRFRVEFRVGHNVSEPQTAASPNGEASYFTASPAANHPFTPTNPVSGGSGSTSRPRTSILLGGRSSSYGTPLPSPAMASKVDVPPGCLCAVALVHEKGSMSTFKAVWRRLKEEYGDGSAAYPCFSPTIPNTPYTDSRAMVL